jgi:Lantibiotic biosynthesis dehydratase C-term
MTSRNAPTEWIEVNIVPVFPEQLERLLLDVVDPLIHVHFSGRIATWFYFWEPACRLRMRWREPERADSNRSDLALFLNAAEREGKLAEWYEGNHGEKGKTYQGEADFYGDEVWELTAKDWMSGSELALALVKLDTENRLTRPLELHWGRRVHLFSNQLLLDEVPLCLRHAHAYLAHGGTDPQITPLIRAIEEYLAG